jgi:hypothetical protein
VDEESIAVVRDVRQGILDTDTLATQLRTVSQLVRLEPNPTLVDAFLRRALELMLGSSRSRDGRTWLPRSRATPHSLTNSVNDDRTSPETIGKALSDFCTPSRLLALAQIHDRDDKGRAIVEELARALGPALVPGFVALIDRAAHQVKARAFTPLMCELAPAVAEALLAELDSCGVAAARVIVKVLGYAGRGTRGRLSRVWCSTPTHTWHVKRCARSRAWAHRLPPSTSRDSCATDLKIAAPPPEDALWHFPPAQIATQLRELLRSREFVFKHPQLAGAPDRARGSSQYPGARRRVEIARVASIQILETQPGAGRPEST